MKLKVYVTKNLILDAGTVLEKKSELIVSPPEITMFDQIWNWLEKHPQKGYGINNSVAGVGLTALCFRWSTYFAVLADEDKLISSHANAPLNTVSMISNQEMKRINIEFSSNIAKILERLHKDEDETLDFIQRAYDWLPMPQKRVKTNWETIATIYAVLSKYKDYLQDFAKEQSKKAVSHPYRSLANVIAVLAYRNGEIENIHAGRDAAYCLNQRRMTINQSRKIVKNTSEHLAGVIGFKSPWEKELLGMEKWPDRLAGLPYVIFYPSDWALSKTSSKITLRKEWCK